MGKFCTNCGAQIDENQEKCSYCGKTLKVKSEPVKETKKEEVKAEKVESTPVQNQTPNYSQQNNNGAAPKSKVAAGLLGIFLGGFGVHNFYLGYTGKAVAQLLITVLSCCVLSEISAIWGLIEGILILTGSISTDAQGNKLVD